MKALGLPAASTGHPMGSAGTFGQGMFLDPGFLDPGRTTGRESRSRLRGPVAKTGSLPKIRRMRSVLGDVSFSDGTWLPIRLPTFGAPRLSSGMLGGFLLEMFRPEQPFAALALRSREASLQKSRAVSPATGGSPDRRIGSDLFGLDVQGGCPWQGNH